MRPGCWRVPNHGEKKAFTPSEVCVNWYHLCISCSLVVLLSLRVCLKLVSVVR